MKENGSLCQVEQLPRGCLLEPGLNGGHSQSYKLSGRMSGSTGVRNRANGAVTVLCSSPDCSTSVRLESTEQIRRGGGGEKVLVTGGAGFFGFRLGKALARQGNSVILLDLHQPRWELPDGAVFLQGDVRDYDTLYKVCAGVDCIFHTASYGMSGPEQLRKEQVESVNVGGTNNIINVCCEHGISRLVYTSTVNVVFAGKPIEDGDEDSVPCVPLDKHIDHYSRTKAIAERMILSANRRPLKGGGLLQTCVLRPSGIYGPEERRHLHRVMVNVERRLFSFTFGDPKARMNWVHVDNLVMAHVLAAEGLTPERGCIANGQAYFINDGESVNVFDWMTPLFERLGYTRPLIRLPVSLVYSAAFLMEQLHVALRPVLEIPLLLTRNEVRNIAVSHTFRIEKARQQLGFSPKKYTLADSVDQYLQSRPVPSTSSLQDSRSFLFVLMMMTTMVLVGLVVLVLCPCWHQHQH
ncbi:putative short-chain dehydrogenase/reductase family 42E member 2 isoform X5 [Neoarius graeffei]|uniref:putative short-chain dehydrogenase/reductase family 42E member 2 isoform X5 n=1 Tax=Neoarius graeffei TaxID=443677 RepID=UPI00298D3D90|nr:putative short-chain dehydrogenase/reductase family 42E member 2 isoform X5 [Neoarius graeffei]